MINICIHGHFYQPPRENPWTGEIEKQPGAAPYHDWNERILHECYLPNTKAKIIDDKGKTIERVNNYEYISFNFGPTLLHWIKTKHHETYKKIIHADRLSIEQHKGHGNAIAMCYNHIIMPLANYRDKITQIRWGLKDFEYHFKRKSEGIWLPETACNMETIEALIDEGLKFIILDTGQADSIRKLKAPPVLPKGEEKINHDKQSWQDVSQGIIDPKFSYKCFSELDSSKYINIFFYDGPVSKAVAFDDVLVSSENLLLKINQAIDPKIKDEALISVATDGETFGHHKKFADRTLAFFIKTLVPKSNLKIYNFGEFLEQHPSKYEVKIKSGDNNEGTSWSCPHGVKRWKEDCGCGKTDNWSQKWRTPLRDSLNWLRDELSIIYELSAQKYFKEPWKARNNYIDCILDNSLKQRQKFFASHSTHILSKDERKSAMILLEMQKYSLLMYSSDGWFFSEISGLETVQILQYAARAIEIAENISQKSLEKPFLELLSPAESNLPEYQNGLGVWDKLVSTSERLNK